MIWAAFTSSKNNSSARYRIRYLCNALHGEGIYFKEYPAYLNSFPPKNHFLRPIWGVLILLERALQLLLASVSAEVFIFQRELVSTISTFEPYVRHRFTILDIDDAVWVCRDGKAVKSIASSVDLVVCGNKYLESYIQQYNKNTIVIHTPVDTDVFKPLPFKADSVPGLKILGWSGTSGGYVFFTQEIQLQINSFLENHNDWVFEVISDSPPKFKYINNTQVRFKYWTESNEVSSIQKFTIGLMPIKDDIWGRGKCSFKLLQYMSCGIPSICSAVGMNLEVITCSDYGFAVNNDEWGDALERLSSDPDLYKRISINARSRVVESYDVNLASDLWKRVARGIRRG